VFTKKLSIASKIQLLLAEEEISYFFKPRMGFKEGP